VMKAGGRFIGFTPEEVAKVGAKHAFLKPMTVQRLTREGLERIAPTVESLAAAEGMPAHAEAVRRRLDM